MKYLGRESKALREAIALLPMESIGSYSVRGKTGSCLLSDQSKDSQVGWYVGHAQKENKEYAFVLRFLVQDLNKTKTPAGVRAKELFLNWLKEIIPASSI